MPAGPHAFDGTAAGHPHHRNAPREAPTPPMTAHADDEAYYDKVWYWATPQADCADDDAATTCKDQDDWVEAWTKLRGA